MKVKWKKYLAFILAIALVISSGVFSSDRYLKATDGEKEVAEEVQGTEEDVVEENANAAAELALAESAEGGEETATVEEVAEEAPTEAPVEEVPAEAPVEEAPAEAPAEETPAVTPADESSDMAASDDSTASTETVEAETEEVETEAETEVETEAETETEEDTEEETEEDTEEETEEDTEDDVKKPAATVKVTADDGTVITVSAPKGVLPKGFKVKAKVVSGSDLDALVAEQLEAAGVELVSYVAYDVTIYDKKGKEIQPDGSVSVTIGSPAAEGDYQAVYHVDDSGNVDKTNEVTGSEATISADHFSVFINAVGASPNDSSTVAISGDTEVYVGSTITLTVTGATGGSWSISRGSSYASVDNEGVVTGKRAGTATVTYSYKTGNGWGSRTKTVSHTVTVKNFEINISGDTSVDVGNTIQLTADVKGGTWSVLSGSSYASVDDESGLVTGLKEGSATIKYTVDVNGKEFSSTYGITVNPARTITFKYYPGSPNDSAKIGDYSSIKFCVLLVDENGNQTYYDGSVADLVINSSTVSINASTFASIDIEGYSFAKAYAYFPWYGSSVTDENSFAPVLSFKNFGKVGSGTHYDSYIGFTTTYGSGSDFSAYPDSTGYYAYNPTGTLRLVFYKITADTPNTNYVVNDSTTLTQIDTTLWKNGGYTYYPKDMTSTYNQTYMEENYPNEGSFEGWYTDSACTKLVTSSFFDTAVTGDVTLYAKWNKEKEVSYTVNYLLNGTTDALAESTTGTGIWRTTATAEATDIDGYTPVSASGSVKLVKDETKNVINLYYYKNVTVTANSDTKNYDGTEKSVSGYSVTEGILESYPGAEFEGISAGAKGTDAGEYASTFAEGTVGTVSSNGYYIIAATADGTLTINPVDVTVEITGNTDTKAYSGSEQSVTGYEVTGTSDSAYTSNYVGLAEGVEAVASGTDAGTYNMGLTAESFVNTNVNYNVTFSVTDGALTIEQADAIVVEIEGNHDSKVYDKTAITVSGYTVKSISNSIYTEDDFALKEDVTDSASGTHVGTYGMGLAADSFENTNANFKNVSFVVTDGYAEITERPITVTSATDSKAYDKTALTNDEVTVTSGSFADGESFVYDVTGSQTEVGNSANTFTYTAGADTDLADYSVTKIEGTLTVSEKDGVVVTITENSGTFTYNGEAQSVSGYTVSTSDDSYSTSDFTFNGNDVVEGTVAGTYEMQLVASDFENTNANFKDVQFVIVDGSLVINPIEAKITIKAGTGTKVYDGNALSADYSYTDGVLLDGDALTATVSGEITNVGEATSKVTGYTIKRGDVDVTNCYTVGKEDGTLTVTVRPVKVTSEGKTKEYDGTALTESGYSIESTSEGRGLVSGETITVTTNGSQTDVGTSKNTFDVEAGTADLANYDIEKVEGTLEVTTNTKKIVVKADDATKKYDGTALTEDGYSIVSGETNLPAGATVSATVSGSQTTYGSSENVISDVKVMFGEEDITGFFSGIEANNGTLSVEKAPITIKSKDAHKVYDGTPLTENTVEIVSGQLYGEDTLTATTNASVTYVSEGQIDNTYTYEIVGAENYEVTANTGKLYIEKNNTPIVITADTLSKKYDGDALTAGYTTSGELIDNDTIDATVSGTITDVLVDEGGNVQSVPSTITGYTITREVGGETIDVTDCYSNITTNAGTLTVTKRDVTLTSEGATKTYDGTALTANGENDVVIGGDKFVGEEGAEFEITGTLTDAGETDNTFTYTLKDNTKESNYNITVAYGKLVIAEADEVIVNIVGNNASKTYNGAAQNVTGYTVTISSDLYTEDDFTYNGEAKAEGTDAGTYSMNLKASDFVNNSNNFENVTFNITDGTLEIEKAGDITVVANSASKVYDGTALTAGYTYTGTLVEGHELEATTEGEITDYAENGAVNKIASYVVKDGDGKDVTANYNFLASVDGTLKIAKRPVTIATSDATKQYDGTALTADGYEITETNDEAKVGFVGTDSVAVNVTGTITNVGTAANTFDITAAGTTNLENYNITETPGTLEITANTSKLVITADNGEKEYDGTALTVSTASLTEGTLPEGAVITAENTGSQTNAGASDNILSSYKITLGGKDITGYYTNVEKRNGSLNVSKKNVVLLSATDEKKYDGTALTNANYTFEDGTAFVEGEGITITSSASIIDKGEIDNTFAYAANDGTNLNNYTISANYGKLKVTERSVTLTSATDSATYTGDPLVNTEVTVSGDGFVDGEGVRCDVTGSQTVAGYSDNLFTYVFNEGTKAANYNVSTVYGILTVAASDDEIIVTVTANSDIDEAYDGSLHELKGYTISSTNPAYTEADFTYSGTDSISEKNAGTYTLALDKSKFKNTNNNYSNVTFNVIDGTLVIAKRPVTVTSDGATKEYDGTALTANEASNVSVTSELGFVDGEAPEYNITGSITDVIEGGADNTFTYEFASEEIAGNYVVTPVYGKLYVTKNTTPITISAKDAEKVYDGTELKAEGFDFTEGVLASGEVLTAEVTGTAGANVSTGTSRIASYKVTRASDNKDVTAFYTFTESNTGTLKITARPVTLTSEGSAKMYDGTALVKEVVNASTGTNEGFVGEDTVTYSNFASQTTVTGESGVDNTFDYTFTGSNENNYSITKKYGKLKVYDRDVKFEVTVMANGGEFKYDGTTHTVDGFVNETEDGIPVTVGGVNYTVTGLTSTATVKDVADSTVTSIAGTALVKDENGNDVTSQFIVHANPANVTVTKRSVILTSQTQSWPYDGDDHYSHDVTVTGDGFVDEEDATYTFEDDVKVTYAGENKTNAFTYTLKENTDANNYNITTNYGQLTVTNRSDDPDSDDAKYIIYVEANSGEYTYDGEAKTVSGFKADTYRASNGATYTVSGLTAGATLTDAGTATVTIDGTAVVTDANGKDVTAQFVVNSNTGTLKINPRTVKIRSVDAEQEYNGSALVANEVEYSGDGFVGSDSAIITYTGSQLLVGFSENFFTYELATGVNADNYTITTEYGVLNVTPRDAAYEITVKANSAEEVYDGSEKTVSGFEETEFTVEGNTYTVSGLEAYASGTEAGTYTTTITGKAVVTDASGNDVSDQFTVHAETGTLTIKGVYTLTINYVDASGNKLADSYVGNYVEGETFGPIDSPEVEGYTPAFRAIYSDEGGMPARDVEVDVLYTANPITDDDDDDSGEGDTETEKIETDSDDTGVDGVEPTVDDETDDTGVDGVEPTADDSVPTGETTGDTTADGTTDTTDNTTQLVVPVTDTQTGTTADTTGDEGEGTTIADGEVPAGQLTIDTEGNPTITQLADEDVPLAANVELTWAIINLLAAIITALLSLILLFTYFTKKKEEDEKINNKEGEVMDEDEEYEIKKRGFLRLISIIPAVVAIVLFVLTEDMTKTMVLTDKWTLCMVIILILQVIIAFFTRKKKTEKDPEGKEPEATA
ncbi:MAG: InlB B-repeat-containing protein [Lachnospiraceae bacterium]|nr:InlB B-repeat-containing protein [Lachnospiraceae bacterium]